MSLASRLGSRRFSAWNMAIIPLAIMALLCAWAAAYLRARENSPTHVATMRTSMTVLPAPSLALRRPAGKGAARR